MTKTIVDYAKEGNLENVKRLAKKASDDDIGTAVEWGASAGHMEIVKYLRGLWEERKKKSKTIIDYAKNGDLEVVEFLADEVSDYYLAIAMRNGAGQFEIVRWIMENHGERVSDYLGWVVQHSAEKGYLEVVKYLMENYGKRVDDDNVGYAVAGSAREGHFEIVRWIMENYGQRVDDEQLGWAVAWSAESGHLEIVEYLIENHGHRVEDYYVHMAGERSAGNRKLEIVEYLENVLKERSKS